MADNDPVDEFLAHYGVLGMKWGVRKSRDSKSRSNNSEKNKSKKRLTKKQKITISVVGATLVLGTIAAAVLVKNNKNKKLSEIKSSADKAKNFVDQVLEEPKSTIHLSRAKNKGFTFIDKGGLSDAMPEWERAGGASQNLQGHFKRYGANNEKVYAVFLDPLGRKDFANRTIPHEVIVPLPLSKEVNNMDDVMTKVWPRLKDTYEKFYNS